MNGFFGPSRDFEKFLYRYDEATRKLGVNPLARQIFRTLLFDTESPWNVTRLADRFGHARSTVREIIDRNENNGYMRRNPRRQIFITESGSDILKWVNEETCEIALGNQVGFSEGLIRHFRDMGLPVVDAEASTIRFQNDLNLF